MNDSLAQMADGVIVSDTQANIVLINPKALSHLGQPADADPVGRALLPGLANLITVEGDDWSRRLRHVLWEGLSEQFEARDAQSRDLLIHLTPFMDRGQRIRGVIITLSDISPFKISERQRREMLDFLSHDLRSPLVSIIALTQIAEQRGNSELPQQVRSAARRTLDLAESFVQLTRAEHLDRTALTEVDLVFVAESVREQIRPQAERRGIRLRQRVEPAQARVMGDGALLERALMNLLDNAVKYSPAGSEVWLGLRPEDGQIHCWVADTGPGITHSDQERLFQRFQRLDPDPRTRGAGLGLAFVKTVVDRHGGRIEVDSESGRGSCFSLWLPAAPRQRDAAGESDLRD
jgi:signal transduction histidine kinase